MHISFCLFSFEKTVNFLKFLCTLYEKVIPSSFLRVIGTTEDCLMMGMFIGRLIDGMRRCTFQLGQLSVKLVVPTSWNVSVLNSSNLEKGDGCPTDAMTLDLEKRTKKSDQRKVGKWK
ncbi:hypothetical protein D918_03426 [Trichuris suis]|nr:hypothetical protein D918_03426 [Trichuris suis]